MLCCAFFILLVLIPGTLYFNFADSTHKDEIGVLLENKQWYGAELNENYLFKNVPQTIFRAIELQTIKSRSKADVDALKKLMQDSRFEDLLPRTKSKRTVNLNLKPLLLILGHMFQCKELEIDDLQEDLAYVRKSVPLHLQCMLNVAIELNQLQQKGISRKVITGKNIETLLNFQQTFT